MGISSRVLAFGLVVFLTVSRTTLSWSSTNKKFRRSTVLKSDEILECATFDEADRLKTVLYQLGASFDRGFGASPRAREQAMSVIKDLEGYNLETNASRGIEGPSETEDISPLTGNWRMIWTTAVDVLGLQASPLFIAGAIYQVFEPPVVTNVIDFLPRAQSLLPPGMIPNSLLRAQVTTRADRRKPNRVGLVFERVQLQPLQLLGRDIDIFPPLAVDLPTLPGTTTTEDSPGFFDVSYLDKDLLIIRQNEPGGLFVLVRVDSIEA